MTREHQRRPGCCPAHDWPPVDGCRWCGALDDDHRVRTAAQVGPHHWAPPTDHQRELRARHYGG
ncbi:hypothetical protein [Actinokineospora enzanensis]|uniref:hypothetical protein n=1 Tax=Actinokineospora enzanensis TaxID=155975 RepID=UPI00052676A1|nr:hypothetical protein [Actinokineospora enzanensis]